MLEVLHPGDPDAVDKEIDDIEVALKLSANSASMKAMFTMGPQRIFHRVVLASVVQIMLQASCEYLLRAGLLQANVFATVHRRQRNSLLHSHDLPEQSGLSRDRSWRIGCSITSVHHRRRHRLRLYRRSLRQKNSHDLQCSGNVGLPSLRDGTGINRQPRSSESGCFLSVRLTGEEARFQTATADTPHRYLYYFVYTLGFIGIPFLYASEVAPVQLRAAVCGVSTAISWLFNFLVYHTHL